MKWIILKLISFYQKYLSKYTPDCIYEPSCSNYCCLAINKYGVFKGLKKFRSRLNRCDMTHLHNYGMKDLP